jgi:AraC-like DNA-binding protein
VFCLTPTANGQFATRHFIHNEKDQWSLNHNGAYTTVEDNDGNIWVATYGGGVNVITKDKNGKQIVYNLDNVTRKFQINTHRKVRTMALDKDGKVWAGSSDGILICSFKDKQFTITPLQPSEKEPDNILLSKDIVVLARDPHGDMWVGTNSGGLAHAYAKDEDDRWLFKSYGVKDGLPGEEIHSITFDNRGTVWFATDHQICSFDTEKCIFAPYSSLDGVDDTMCSECAATSLPNGDLLFGTINGYYVVERQKLMTGTANSLKLRITDFWIDGELQSPRLNDTYDYYVPESKSVRLPDHNTEFTFRFASLNYQLQHRIHYQYILEGYDTSWQTADKTRTATYSDLPAGYYRFKVKAFLLESPEKYDLRQIEVVVPPYFLLSRNAVWVYMFLASVIGILLMFYRQHQLTRAENIRQLHLTGTAEDFDGDDEEQIFMRIQYEYLEIHISDPHLTVSELAEVSEMDPSDYAAALYRYTHMQPKEFVNSYRLRKAVNLLEQTDDTITDIAFKCGFSDVHAFNRQLNSKIGMTPAKYRDQYRAKHKKEQQEPENNEDRTDEYEITED